MIIAAAVVRPSNPSQHERASTAGGVEPAAGSPTRNIMMLASRRSRSDGVRVARPPARPGSPPQHRTSESEFHLARWRLQAAVAETDSDWPGLGLRVLQLESFAESRHGPSPGPASRRSSHLHWQVQGYEFIK